MAMQLLSQKALHQTARKATVAKQVHHQGMQSCMVATLSAEMKHWRPHSGQPLLRPQTVMQLQTARQHPPPSVQLLALRVRPFVRQSSGNHQVQTATLMAAA